MSLTEPSVFKTVLFIYSKIIKLTSKNNINRKVIQKKKKDCQLCVGYWDFWAIVPQVWLDRWVELGGDVEEHGGRGTGRMFSVSWEHKQTPCKCPDCFKQYSTSLLFPSNAQKEEYYVAYFKTISICPKKTKNRCHWHLESNFSICLPLANNQDCSHILWIFVFSGDYFYMVIAFEFHLETKK